jgi:hypothetical protein
VFADGGPTATVLTDAEGRAIGRAFRTNKTAGRFEIRVTASHEGATAAARIVQTNAEPVELSRGGSSKKIAILAAVGGAVAVGAALAARGGGAATSSPTVAGAPAPPATGAVITAGNPTFGPP